MLWTPDSQRDEQHCFAMVREAFSYRRWMVAVWHAVGGSIYGTERHAQAFAPVDLHQAVRNMRSKLPRPDNDPDTIERRCYLRIMEEGPMVTSQTLSPEQHAACISLADAGLITCLVEDGAAILWGPSA